MHNKMTVIFGIFTVIFTLFGIFSPYLDVRTMAILLTTLFSIMFFHFAENYMKKSISQQVEHALKKDHEID